jgi:hypothetical protein
MDSIPWVHHSTEEGSIDYAGGFVRLQVHLNFNTNIYRQQESLKERIEKEGRKKNNNVKAYMSFFFSQQTLH